MKIRCLFGFHSYEKLLEDGIYGNPQTSWHCIYCRSYVPFWSPKGWKMNGKKYPK